MVMPPEPYTVSVEPYALDWHIGQHPRLWVALKDGPQSIATGQSVNDLAASMAEAIAVGKGDPRRVPVELRANVASDITLRAERVGSTRAERLRSALMAWGMLTLDPGADFRSTQAQDTSK